MDCKKALTNADGDMDKAVDFLREQGLAKQAKTFSVRFTVALLPAIGIPVLGRVVMSSRVLGV